MEHCEDKNVTEFFQILNQTKIATVFQPIISLQNGQVMAYEALSRITLDGCNMSISDMFDMAAHLKCLWRLEKVCRSKAVKNAIKKPDGVKLFLNVDPNVIQDPEFVSGFTKEYLDKYKLRTKDIVFEITERSDVENYEILQNVVHHYEEQGFEIALDDVGAGYSGLNRINYLNPKFLKIDMELIHHIYNSKSKKSLVSMLVKYCENMNGILIAEGIEQKEELECLIQLGVKYGQGYYLGKPNPDFIDLEENKIKQIQTYQRQQKTAIV